jgi:hypothetical protein
LWCMLAVDQPDHIMCCQHGIKLPLMPIRMADTMWRIIAEQGGSIQSTNARYCAFSLLPMKS